MRRTLARLSIVAILMTALVAPAGEVRADDYQSSFGFGITVPEVWLVLTRGEILENAASFFGQESEAERDGQHPLDVVPTEIRQLIFERVRSGELEIFYRREGVAVGFVDNVNIMLQPASLPADQAGLLAICRILPGEFSRIFGRPIGMDRCEMRDRVMRRVLYLEFDGAIPGTKTLQYQVERDRGQTLVFTATASVENLSRMIGEFESMVASIRFR